MCWLSAWECHAWDRNAFECWLCYLDVWNCARLLHMGVWWRIFEWLCFIYVLFIILKKLIENLLTWLLNEKFSFYILTNFQWRKIKRKKKASWKYNSDCKGTSCSGNQILRPDLYCSKWNYSQLVLQTWSFLEPIFPLPKCSVCLDHINRLAGLSSHRHCLPAWLLAFKGQSSMSNGPSSLYPFPQALFLHSIYSELPNYYP